MNYQLEMQKRIDAFQREGKRPLLLLHCCCAPCSSAVLERLCACFRLLLFYYNPNIEPEAEYTKRYEELVSLAARMPGLEGVRVMRGEYDCERFHSAIHGFENLGEGSERCARCFRLRLVRTAEQAQREGADFFATTLTLSPLKNPSVINTIGSEIGGELGIEYLPSDFKKKDGYKRSCELSQQYGLYRQDYCGCIYSRMERERRIRDSRY